MIDYYAMPQKEPDGWPGRARSTNLIASETKARCVEDAMLDNIVKEMGDSFDPSRFVPFVMMQEFKALPFSDCAAFSRAIYNSSLEPALRQIRSQFTTEEDIDDSPTAAPSNASRNSYPDTTRGYSAFLQFSKSASLTSAPKCPHFKARLRTLEATAPPLSANPSQTSGNR